MLSGVTLWVLWYDCVSLLFNFDEFAFSDGRIMLLSYGTDTGDRYGNEKVVSCEHVVAPDLHCLLEYEAVHGTTGHY